MTAKTAKPTDLPHLSGDQTTVTGRVTGDFRGSPVDLQYRFTIEGDKIARLEIGP